MLKVGSKIKEFRLRKGLSLEALSEKAGIPVEQIKMVEEGQERPTVATLMKISNSLELSMGVFFQEKESRKLYELTRKIDIEMQYAESHKGHHTTYRYANLMPNFQERNIEPFIAEFPFLSEDKIPLDTHLGHEFIYILEGSLLVEIGEERLELLKGDSLNFDSSYPHRYIPQGDLVPKVICILMPPKEK